MARPTHPATYPLPRQVWLEESLRAQSKSIHSWYNLFNEADLDGSGFITYDELEDVTRRRLKQGPSSLSDDRLKALWCALDVDDSNSIMPEEMGKFLKRGRVEHKSKGPSNLNKKSIELGQVTDGGALACQPTSEMRAALPAELMEGELDDLAKKMCKWLEESLHKQNKSIQ